MKHLFLSCLPISMLTFFFFLTCLPLGMVTSQLFADEFIVKSFSRIDNKILTNSEKVYDDNDELCAIVLVRTSLVDLGVSGSTPIVGNVNWVEGDYKVNLSEGTRMIKFFKKGFESLEYIFPQRIEKGKFYLLELEYRRTDAVAEGNTMGFVLINSNPTGADVFVNNEATGMQTPFQNPYNEGYYKFSLKMTNYLNYEGEFTIIPNETQKKIATLKPDFGGLSLTYSPVTDVTVLIDGIKTDKTSPINIEKLSSGNHTLSISKFMYETHEQTFTINRELTTTLSIDLKPNFGSLNLRFTPASADAVSIDGNPVAQNSPCTIAQLTPGKHSLRLTKNMYLTHEQEFEIEKGVPKTLEITLTPTFGTIKITTAPEATIYIDKQKKSTGTYSGSLIKGIHLIEVEKEKYYPQSRQVDIKVGVTQDEQFTLLPMQGVLSIMTTPAEVDIYLNNEPLGQSPKFINNLMVGTYTLKLQKQGYSSVTRTIEVLENQTTTINETLASGKEVTITSDPSGAQLSIDGASVGITPKTISLGFGSHKIKLVNGKKVVEQSLAIKEGGQDSFSFDVSEISNFIEGSSGVSFEMIAVKGGTFQMGSPANEKDRGSDETQHQVTVSDFYIGKYEVTQKQWQEIMGTNPSNFKGDNLPVEQVSWNDIQEFIKKLNQKTGKNYRLPTEAEWEYACKAGTSTPFNTGNNLTTSQANYDGNYPYNNNAKGEYRAKTMPVGSFSPNSWGIYDMHGNVWEWCSDWYGNYPSGSQTNPQGLNTGSDRVSRGGSWGDDAQFCRSAYRYDHAPGNRNGSIGFRLALPK